MEVLSQKCCELGSTKTGKSEKCDNYITWSTASTKICAKVPARFNVQRVLRHILG